MAQPVPAGAIALAGDCVAPADRRNAVRGDAGIVSHAAGPERRAARCCWSWARRSCWRSGAGADAVVMVLVALALLMAACLDRQSLARVPLYAALGLAGLAALAALGAQHQLHVGAARLRHCRHRIAVGLPLAARASCSCRACPGPCGPAAGRQARTGLGDEMSPGSISELSSSDDIAFRVRFEGAAPPRPQRYWRGPVLHDFDG